MGCADGGREEEGVPVAGEWLAVGDVVCVSALAAVPEPGGVGGVAAAGCAASGVSVFPARLRMARLRCTLRLIGSGSTACNMMLSGSACCSSDSRSDFMAKRSESLLM